MKILHLNEHLSLKGGVETYLFSAIPQLEERGIESQVVYSKGDASFFPNAHHIPYWVKSVLRRMQMPRINLQKFSTLKSQILYMYIMCRTRASYRKVLNTVLLWLRHMIIDGFVRQTPFFIKIHRKFVREPVALAALPPH